MDARRAALTLHALPDVDRGWVLRRLDPRQQRVVEGHLEELRALGIPADVALVDEALQRADVPEPENAWHRVLTRRDAAVMIECLCDEPAMLIARVLNRGPWRWANSVLEAMTPERRAQIQECQRQGHDAIDLDEWLIAELAARLESIDMDRSVIGESTSEAGFVARVAARVLRRHR